MSGGEEGRRGGEAGAYKYLVDHPGMGRHDVHVKAAAFARLSFAASP